MAVAEIIVNANGGGGGVSYQADLSDLLATLTTQIASYTATKDCVITGSFLSGSGGVAAELSLDGTVVLKTDAASSKGVYIGKINSTETGYGICVKKGQVISTGSYGNYNLNIYGMA